MERRLYDLTSADEVLFFSQSFSLFKQLNNVVTSCFFLRRMDEELFRRAVGAAVSLNDSFSSRFIRDRDTKKLKRYFGEPEVPDLGFLDFRGKSEEDMRAEFLRLAKHCYTRTGPRPLYKLYIAYSPDGYLGLFFVVSHLILDSWGIIVFYNHVYGIYHAMETGGEMPKPVRPFEDILRKEAEYPGSEKYRKDKEFWENEWRKPEPIFTHPDGNALLEEQRKKAKDPGLRCAQVFQMLSFAKHVVCPMPAGLVASLGEYAKQQRVSLQSLFLLGVTAALGMLCDHQEDVTVHTVNARRGTLAEKNTGGNRVHFSPYRRVLPNSHTFQQAAEACYEKQAAILRHIEFPPLELLGMWPRFYGISRLRTYSCMSVTFQPVPMLLPDGTKTRTAWHPNGVASQVLYLTVMDDDGSGGLRCYYEYQTLRLKEGSIRRLHRAMEGILAEGTADPHQTMEEIYRKVEAAL